MTGDEGFNAATETYEDLVKAGVIDPAKVVRSALQNASSIASLLLTTEALISEIPEGKPGAPRGRRRHGCHVLGVRAGQRSSRAAERPGGARRKPRVDEPRVAR